MPAPQRSEPADSKLDRDRFLVNQKHASWMKSKYYVFDEGGAPLFYVERPVKPLRRSDITIYDDDVSRQAVLVLRQTHGYAAIRRTYTLEDAATGETIAHFERHNIKSWLRRTWTVTDASGAPIAIAREDSAALAAIRRLLEWVPYVSIVVSFIRTNFRIWRVDGEGTQVECGAFNRKLSLGDKYALDLSADFGRQLDRRVALALGIMLDTGEAR